MKLDTKSLEAAFFLKEDQILIEKLRVMKKMQETKEALAQVSGIKNEKVLEKLVQLDVHPEIVASLAVVPLVEVAWADGTVDEKEKKALLSRVEKSGIVSSGIEYQLIERWLEHRPEPRLLEAWTHYIEGLCEQLNEVERQTLQAELLRSTKAVAEASGGWFGLFGSKISRDEATMIAKLEAAFSSRQS